MTASDLRVVLERVRDLRELAEKAMPGPWVWTRYKGQPPNHVVALENPEDLDVLVATGDGSEAFAIISAEDQAFIAAAREGVPNLLEAVSALAALVQRLADHGRTVPNCACAAHEDAALVREIIGGRDG